jgi:diaminopimelate epimerase
VKPVTLEFAKMHGLGNDFMVLDLVTQLFTLTPDRVRAWADRRTGVGFDQLLAIEPPTDPDFDFRYRIFNADGTEVEQCGNGARCAARFVALRQLSPKETLRLQTLGGPLTTYLLTDGQVEVDLGEPGLTPESVPFDAAAGGAIAVPDTALACRVRIGDQEYEIAPVSMGNPHCVLFVDTVAEAPVEHIGSALVGHPVFPEGANVGFCQVVDQGFMRLRVYERGVGETRACGTGACAAVVVAQLQGAVGQRVKVSLPGGKVRIGWQGPGSPVRMTGPATLVFEGRIQT